MPKPEKPIDDSGKKQKPATASAIAAAADKHYTPDYEDDQEPAQRLIVASSALQKRGKTTFGFSMPGPLAYLQLDANYEHALSKARKLHKKKDIKHLRYFADPRADIKGANAAVWSRLIRDFAYSVDNFRSVFVDTASELLDVRKLSEFGRTTQILQMYYGGFYADLRWMVKYATDHDANVMFVHRQKKEYVNDTWKGDYELEGWRGIVYEAPIYIEHTRDDEGNAYITTIKECSQDAMLVGTTLSSADDENDFAALATRVFPETERADWED